MCSKINERFNRSQAENRWAVSLGRCEMSPSCFERRVTLAGCPRHAERVVCPFCLPPLRFEPESPNFYLEAFRHIPPTLVDGAGWMASKMKHFTQQVRRPKSKSISGEPPPPWRSENSLAQTHLRAGFCSEAGPPVASESAQRPLVHSQSQAE